jgi:oligoendopeptidase F
MHDIPNNIPNFQIPYRNGDITNTYSYVINKIVSDIEEGLIQFERLYNMINNDILPKDFHTILHLIEHILENLANVHGYARLCYYSNSLSRESQIFMNKMENLRIKVSNRLLLFDLWFINVLDERNACRLIDETSSPYNEYLLYKRSSKIYSLTESEEKLITLLNKTSNRSLVRIYELLVNGFSYNVHLQTKNNKRIKKFSKREKMFYLLSNPNPDKRCSAYKSLCEVYQKNSLILGEIYRGIVIQWYNEFILARKYKSPISVRNRSNNLDDSIIKSMLNVCKNNTAIFQEYFRFKSKIFGKKKLEKFDIFAPFPSNLFHRDIKLTYDKAISILLETFGDFDSRFKLYAQRMFAEKHVDHEIRKGKRNGALCYTFSPKVAPFILLNFHGKINDIFTMAHELGHAIHHILSADKPIIVCRPPLPLSETASIFAEMLLYDKIIEIYNKHNIKKNVILKLSMYMIENIYSLIMRQAYFTLFEIDAHNAIIEENSTNEQLCKIYLNNQKEQFGNSVHVSSYWQVEWMDIQSIYRTPFYLYSYTFGNLLSLSLYQRYKQDEKLSFVKKYYRLLSAGGSVKPEHLIKREFGMDISQMEFWQQGFNHVKSMIFQLKEMF